MASPRFWMNDAELDALSGLPLAARVAYTEGIKPFMDYKTGVVGASNSPSKSISLQSIAEVLYVEPKQGRTDTGSRTRKQARVVIDVLIEAGLLASMSVTGWAEKRLILKCVLADTDESEQKKQGTNRAREQGTNRARAQVNENAGLGGDDHPKHGNAKTAKQGTPPNTYNLNNTHITRTREKAPIGADFHIDGDVATYLQVSGVAIELAEALLPEFVSKNLSSGFVSLNWAGEFAHYCLKQKRYTESFNARVGKKRAAGHLQVVSPTGTKRDWEKQFNGGGE